jgi:PAS domain S-box-containing protein
MTRPVSEVRQALLESEARFQLLCASLADGIIVCEDGKILEANGGLSRILGYSTEEIVGKGVTWWVAEEYRELVSSRVAAGIEGTYEVELIRKGGGRVLVEATGRTLIEAGRTRRITALRDITEKRKLEDQFRHAQKMEAVGRLAGGVAHDFNNLLTVITSYCEMVSSDMTPSDPRRLDMAEIQKAAGTAASLTRQLLAFSRQQVTEPRVLALEDVIGSAGKLLRRLIGEDIELQVLPGPERAAVRMDPGQLEQVIMNLAVNARDAMPDGGVLSIETGRAELTDQYAARHCPAKPGHYAMLAVTDTGVGMTADVRSRIFEPFYTTKEEGKGTGLGLATVYGIVKQNDGFIWVYSEPGRGTTFKIYLPLVQDGCQAGAEEEEELEDLRGSETVLLVEDSAAVRRAAREILVRQGYQVLECPDGDSALELAGQRGNAISLLLTDVVMPVMNGRELGERFLARCPDAQVIYMSGYPDQAIVSLGVLAPGMNFIQKPFSPPALARKVRQVLGEISESAAPPQNRRAWPAGGHSRRPSSPGAPGRTRSAPGPSPTGQYTGCQS